MEVDSTDQPGTFQTIYKTDWGDKSLDENGVPKDGLPGTQPVTQNQNPVLDETLYSNTFYNKYEFYAAPDRTVLETSYFKLPNLLDRFIRGGDENIGEYYEDTLKNHKHASNGHNHDFTVIDAYQHSHNYSGSTSFAGQQVNNHEHNFVLQTIDVSFDKIREGVSTTTSANKGKLLVPGTLAAGASYTDAEIITTSLAGSHIPAGNVTVEPVNSTISIDIRETNPNSEIKNSQEDISGILDMNKNPITESNETRPKHVILLPCIAIGTNNVQSSSSNLESYSVENRVRILENRTNNFDICMNSSRINIHRFSENPSGTGLTAI